MIKETMKPERTLRQRLLFVTRVTMFTLVALAVAVPLALGAGFMSVLTAAGCGGESTPPMPFEDVNFPSSEFNRPTPAYFIPAAAPNGATVIVVPTGNLGRGNRMSEIEVYHAGGFHVLTYSSRGCLGATSNSLGYRDAGQVADALAYLETRSNVDVSRIGIHGFSAGGAAAIMAAARFPQISAVVAQGGYHDFREEVERNTLPAFWFAPLFRFAAFSTYRITTGDDISVLSPVSVIGQIAPRPILLVYGADEPSLYAGRLQQSAAGSNLELWEVPGAGHGNYFAAALDEYRRRVIGFMVGALE